MNRLHLTGCRPEPLAGYLKALGVLRMIGEQADPGARGNWDEAGFVLHTALSENDLLAFFNERYHPTPIVAPWNGGSGFYEGDQIEGIDAICSSTGARLAPYRAAVSAIRGWPEMPRAPQAVGDVCRALEGAAAVMQPGKAKNELDSLVRAIGSATAGFFAEVASETGSEAASEAVREMSLEALETLAKARSGKMGKTERQRRAGELWREVRKGRTKCLQLSRSKGKPALLALCRCRLSDDVVQWLDATCALNAEGAPAYFSPLLGSGGNEGRLDFSNAFMQHIAELLANGDPAGSAARLIAGALFDVPVPGLVSASVGQFDPGRAGGFNQGQAIESKDCRINPWDFVLTLEGALLMASAITRRTTAGGGKLSAPFCVAASAVGYPSAGAVDAARAEAWLPIWSNPTAPIELRHILAEGRSQLGRRSARTGLDFSRAASSLGVDRGIASFVRYSFLKRRGESFVALPVGRIPVQFRPAVRLLDELDPLLARIDFFLRRFKNVPATLAMTRRQVDEALFSCSRRADAVGFTGVLAALGRLERLIARRDRGKKPTLPRPSFGLSARWVAEAAASGSLEVRLAAALASVRATGKVGPLRANLAPVDPARLWSWAEGHGQVAWVGGSLAERLAGVLARRMLDAQRSSTRSVPVAAHLSLPAEDVMPFLGGQMDDGRIDDLLWAFGLIDWRKADGLHEARRALRRTGGDSGVCPLSRSYSLLKLLFSPEPVRSIAVRPEPRIVGLLQAGRGQDACSVAVQRLLSAQLKPLRVTYQPTEEPQRLLASLLVPIRGTKRLEKLVLADDTSR
ncbi:MAG: type I-U CRISPR-associated protein Csx17 [Candidatus Schekmanbacteria bacterium]|nr:type I-U CRISPR-associated protein Csx17 [Candidatus Schekmanbacteria bacterium]